MKKLATTFGLLALMLIVTSFTTPEIGGGGKGTPGDGGKDPIGGQFEIGGGGKGTTGEKDPLGGQFGIGGGGKGTTGEKNPLGGQ